jgi:hypothetical protein
LELPKPIIEKIEFTGEDKDIKRELRIGNIVEIIEDAIGYL